MNAARACYEKARDFFTAANSHPEDYPQALQGLIRTHLALGDIGTARTYQTECGQLFNQYRQRLLNQYNKAKTAEQIKDAEFELSHLTQKFTIFTQKEIDLLLAEDKTNAALEQAEFYKNRSLTWLLDHLPPSSATDITLSYAQIQSLCQTNTAAIYWHQSLDNLTTFLILPCQTEPTALTIVAVYFVKRRKAARKCDRFCEIGNVCCELGKPDDLRRASRVSRRTGKAPRRTGAAA